MKNKFIILLLLLCGYATGQIGEKPNVLLIMVDDLGYHDIGFNGSSEISTPNIDAIANSSVSFSNYYTSGPVCTPTRCALMTGRYQARFENMEGAFHLGVTHIGLKKDEETIGKILQRNGYSTGMVGKWHLGEKNMMQPQNQGFDYFYGFLGGNVNYFTHCKRDGQLDLYNDGKKVKTEGYLTDLITEKSVSFIERHTEKPFFLYVAFNSPHWPYQGPNDREKDLTGPKWIKSGSRSNLKSMIERMDDAIGQIVNCLKDQGLYENTVIVFCNDNGGDRLADNRPFRGRKGSLLEGGLRSPLFITNTKNFGEKKIVNAPCITMDITVTICNITKSKSMIALDGINLFDESKKQRTLCWRYGKSEEYAVRRGEWKLYCKNENKYLYNLHRDTLENNDCKETHLNIFSSLEEEFAKWEKAVKNKQTKFGNELMSIN